MADAVAGVVPGLLIALHCTSVGAILTSGPLAGYRTAATTLVLFGCGAVALLLAWRSSLRFVLVMPSYFAAAILVPALRAVAVGLESAGHPEEVGPTLWAFLGTATAFGGVLMFLLGRVRQTSLVRYIPYPIIAGILASAGWLMCKAGVSVLATGDEPVAKLLGQDWLRAAPAALLVAMVLVARRRVKSAAALPLLLALFIGAAHVVRVLAGLSLPEAQAAGWFLRPFDVDAGSVGLSMTGPHIAWEAIAGELSTILIVSAIMPTIVALQTSAAELVVGNEADMDREFRVMGAGNALVGAFGGIFATIASGMTALSGKLGAESRLATAFGGATVLSVLFLGSKALSMVPTAVVAGLSLSLGAELLIEWLLASVRRLTRAEYALVLLIVAVVIVFGFVEGVLLGLIAAGVLFTVRYSQLEVIRHATGGASFRSNVERPPQQKAALARYGDELYIVRLQGYLFFGTAHKVYAEIAGHRDKRGASVLVLLDFERVTGVDSSAAAVFVKIRALVEGSGGEVIWTGLSSGVQLVLRQAGVLEEGARHFSDLDHGVEWCEGRILNEWVLEKEQAFRLDDQLRRFLAEEDLATFRSYLVRHEVSAGTYVTRQEDASDSMFFLDQGELSVLAELPGGRQRRLRTFMSGTILGEQAFYLRRRRSASIVAEVDSVVFELSRERFEDLQRDVPRLANALHERVVVLLAVRLDQARGDLEGQLR